MWIITYLVMMIPIVNIVMMFVWAFGSNTKPSKANYFKASLLMCIIGTVIISIVIILFGTLLTSLFYSLY